MKIVAKFIWVVIVIATAAFAAVIPLAALVGSILIPANLWGWSYNNTLALAIIVGFLGFISWGFTWAGLLCLVTNKLQGR